jgi:hypothetical protein
MTGTFPSCHVAAVIPVGPEAEVAAGATRSAGSAGGTLRSSETAPGLADLGGAFYPLGAVLIYR